MKRMTEETFKYVGSRLMPGMTWDVPVMTGSGTAGGFVTVKMDEDGEVFANGNWVLPGDPDKGDALWLFLTEGMHLWPRGKVPSFAYTPEQQQRREEKREQRNERREQDVKNGRIAGMKQYVMAGTTEASTEQEIERRACEWLENSGLKPYDNSLTPGFCKGHWVSEHKIDIYKDEWENLPQEHVIIQYRRYGIKDKAIFYDVVSVYFNTLTKGQEREARIWNDVCDGIIGKMYN